MRGLMASDDKTVLEQEKQAKRDNIIPSIAVLLILVIACWFPFHMIPIRDIQMEQYSRIISVLLLLSIFLERAMEVFVTTWRGDGSC